MRSLSLIFVIVFLAVGISAQSRSQQLSKVGPEVAENFVAVIVPQFDSPLRIDSATAVTLDDGSVDVVHSVRNVGKKSIAGYTIARWFSSNTGTVLPEDIRTPTGVLLPGEESADPRIGQLAAPAGDDSVAKAGNNSKKLIRIIFLIITEVRFTDGSKVQNDQVFSALKEHLKHFELVYEKSIDPSLLR
ncbi:MAG: hypothetical protein KIS76_19090 [Pyrinomonadaceae bacterium]|nr:hypothetical protein [Pyrinomonadaceae bacterium]